MATLGEKPKGIKIKGGRNGKTAEIQYVCRNATDPFEAYLLAKSTAASLSSLVALAGLSLGEITVDEHRTDFNTGLQDYIVLVTFSDSEDNKEREEGQETISWSTIGGTEKITQALFQARYSPPGFDPARPTPDVGDAINVTSDGVQGVEQPASKLEFTINHWYNPAFLTDDFLKLVSDKTGWMNSVAWRSFQPGELLFLGGQAAEYSPSQRKPVKVSMNFSGSANATDIVVTRPDGHNITVDTKKGWDYLWVMYQKTVETDSKTTIQIPRGAYVATTKHEMDFAAELGLSG